MAIFAIHKRKPQDVTQFMTAGTQKYFIFDKIRVMCLNL